MFVLKWARSLALIMFAVAIVAGIALLFRDPLQPSIAGPGGIDLGLRLDIISVLLLAFVATIAWIVSTYSIVNLAGQHRTERFGWLMLLATGSLALLVTGASLLIIAIGWTLSGIALARLVAHTNTETSRAAAGFVGRRLMISDAFLWVGIIVAIVVLPTVNRAELASADLSVAAASAVALLFALAAIVRSGLVPFQSWLPETAEAPSPVSALLHAGIVNGAGIIGVLAWPLFKAAPIVLLGLILVGIATVAIGTWTARLRADVKGQLASSTTAQMGYMTVQLGLGLPAAALAHLIAHGYYKAWLFMRAGGAVTRQRTTPFASISGAASPRVRTIVLPVAAVVIGAIVAAPALASSMTSLGFAAILPLLLALTAAAVATYGVARLPKFAPKTVAIVAGFAGIGAAAYQWGLLGWEHLLGSSLPLTSLWATAPAVALIALVIASGIAIAVYSARIVRDPATPLGVRLSGSALSPAVRKWTGKASWPVVKSDTLSDLSPEEVTALVDAASALCAPSWPLRSFVASNPMEQFERFSFNEASGIASQRLGAATYLPLPSFVELYDRGRITDEDLEAVFTERSHSNGLSVGVNAGVNAGADADKGTQPSVRVAQLVARARHGITDATPASARVGGRLVDSLGRPDRGAPAGDLVDEHAALWAQRAWFRALNEAASPWKLWHQAASVESYDAAIGVSGVSALVRELPEDPAQALVVLIERSGLPQADLFEYVSELLLAGPGWASHAHWRARESGDVRAVLELVTLRCALDLLIAGAAGTRAIDLRSRPADTASADLSSQYGADEREDAQIWQGAFEFGFRDQLINAVSANAVSTVSAQTSAANGAVLADGSATDGLASVQRPDAQILMCIDVRSERMRRSIEATSGRYETFGFAGFFGTALRYETEPGVYFDQCPVLIKPTHQINAIDDPSQNVRVAARAAVLAASSAPITPLLVAEAGGLLAGAASLVQSTFPEYWHQLNLRWKAIADRWGSQSMATVVPVAGSSAAGTTDSADGIVDGITVESLPVGLEIADKVALAAGALGAIGLVNNFARLILVCGHSSTTENNAFAAGYDCGACGGNGGQVNARELAEVLNNPQVRAELVALGIEIPADTVAVAAAHDTTTDVIGFDPTFAPASGHAEHIANVKADLHQARLASSQERALALPGARAVVGDGQAAAEHVLRRATDWSQPVPEWGLAGNAAFVIGPRSLTANLDLGGRVFLHSYDPNLDPTNSTLDLLLTAPAVVTQWINSQYYFSTVDPPRFGAGDKTTHNVIGDIGVLSGAHGDLRIGLPWQAIFPGDPTADSTGSSASELASASANSLRGLHEPLRLMVVVFADLADISGVIADHGNLQDLFGNEWASLCAIDPATGTASRLDRHLQWQPWNHIDSKIGATL